MFGVSRMLFLCVPRYAEDEIEDQVSALREELKGEGYQAGPLRGDGGDSHNVAEATQKKNEQLRAAFGIKEDYVEGSAFDIGQQMTRKAEREKEAE